MLGWFIFWLVMGGLSILVVMSLMKAASNADDKMLGDDQYK